MYSRERGKQYSEYDCATEEFTRILVRTRTAHTQTLLHIAVHVYVNCKIESAMEWATE